MLSGRRGDDWSKLSKNLFVLPAEVDLTLANVWEGRIHVPGHVSEHP